MGPLRRNGSRYLYGHVLYILYVRMGKIAPLNFADFSWKEFFTAHYFSSKVFGSILGWNKQTTWNSASSTLISCQTQRICVEEEKQGSVFCWWCYFIKKKKKNSAQVTWHTRWKPWDISHVSGTEPMERVWNLSKFKRTNQILLLVARTLELKATSCS